MEASEILTEIGRQVSACDKCNLHKTRKKSVPGEGPANAEIMLIGEGPGYNENETGRPFVGQAGKFLEYLLGKIGLKREQVFICNVVKCRPPENRDPMPDELLACNDYLERQIAAINPKVIVTLGRFSMAKFLPNARISSIHGQAMWVNSRLVVPMYHPAAALHQPLLKPELEKDFMKLPGYIELAMHPGQTPPKPAAPVPPPPAPAAPRPVQTPPPAQTAPKPVPPKPAPPKAVNLALDFNAPVEPPQPPEEEKKPPEEPTQLTLF